MALLTRAILRDWVKPQCTILSFLVPTLIIKKDANEEVH
jgi:hypothetical protein